MSYSIDVTVPEVPKNLRRKWEQEFAKHGIKVEVDPKFDLTTWNDPVVFKVMEMPRRYAGLDITEPVEGGFGLNVGDSFEGVVSLSARNRSCHRPSSHADWRMCLGQGLPRKSGLP
jgi:hypothetical protein